MRLIPFEKEIIVTSAPSAAIASLLLSKTATLPNETGRSKIFTGEITELRFSISLRETKPQNFIPQIEGTLEDTSTGSLIFVQYHFFRSTNIFLAFWCALTLALTFVFLGLANNYWYGCLSLLGCIANYLIALANFDVHLKHTKKALYGVLEQLT